MIESEDGNSKRIGITEAHDREVEFFVEGLDESSCS